MADDVQTGDAGLTCGACKTINGSAAAFCRECGAALSQPVKVFCSACGIDNTATARFCRKCGVPFGTTVPPFSPPRAARTPEDRELKSGRIVAERSAAEARPGTATRDPLAFSRADSAIASTATKSPRPAILALLVVVVLAGAAAAVFFVIKSGAFNRKAVEFATRMVRVRTSDDMTSSSVVGTLRRGDRVSGSWELAPNGVDRWLKIKWGANAEGYVWGRNLSSAPRPALIEGTARTVTLTTSAALHAEPDTSAPTVGSITPRSRIQIVGRTASSWEEVAAPGGGVGYIQDDLLASS